MFDLYVDLSSREKLIFLIGDTGSSDVHALFDKIRKDMLCHFWLKRHDSVEMISMQRIHPWTSIRYWLSQILHFRVFTDSFRQQRPR